MSFYIVMKLVKTLGILSIKWEQKIKYEILFIEEAEVVIGNLNNLKNV